ncbi:MAG TPA: GGDEF domain-containing protein [Actinomycetota bacterium]|nr:GGDEF domain-containing protein [Actinomycetota bacterium]
MGALQRWLERQSTFSAQAWALASIAVVGYLQYLSGPELVFSIFYVLPLLLLGWKVGGRGAAPACGIAAATAALAEVAFEPGRQDVWVVFWNTASRFGVFLLVASLRAGVERQERLAATDPLTGVANGRVFNEAAARAIGAFRTRGRPVTVCYIDLDDFKTINDSHGHSGGDAALRAVAAALESSTREQDVVARVGGDEFALLLPDTGSEGATRILQSLRDRVAAAPAAPAGISFSIGAATFLVQPGSVDEMIGAADAMMYAAKRAGKATYQHVVVGEGSRGAVPDRGVPREPISARS